ncbi:MAG: leucyl aminopeptidase, partial [Anaerolineae bacterium]
MKVTVDRVDVDAVKADAVVVNLFEGVTTPGGATGALDAAMGSAISDVIASGDFRGKLGDTVVLYSRGAVAAGRVILVGLGKAAEFGLEEVRRAAAEAALKAKELEVERLATIAHGAGVGGLDPAAAAQATVEGTWLALYTFRDYKTEAPKVTPPAELIIVERNEERVGALAAGAAVGEATAAGATLARDLGNHPANTATPTFLADQARTMAEGFGMSWEAWGRERIVAEGMGALASVNQGSAEEPRLIIVEHAPAGHEADPPLVLVGKAITFDTGGISLKPGMGMGRMKFDMCGGGAVLGTLEAVGRLALPARIVGLVAATDNMPSGRATHPGDIVTARNGKTIEVLNTDAEGRLVLADALSYAQGLEPSPAACVDLATLTGAIVVALGHVAAGLFANDDTLADALLGAGEASGERLWRLPTWKPFGAHLKSEVADLRNVHEKRPSPAGSIFAAKFLEEFVAYP